MPKMHQASTAELFTGETFRDHRPDLVQIIEDCVGNWNSPLPFSRGNPMGMNTVYVVPERELEWDFCTGMTGNENRLEKVAVITIALYLKQPVAPVASRSPL